MLLCRYSLELAATATSIAAGYIPCTRYHVNEAKKTGAEDQDIQLALAAGAEIVAEIKNESLSTGRTLATAAEMVTGGGMVALYQGRRKTSDGRADPEQSDCAGHL